MVKKLFLFLMILPLLLLPVFGAGSGVYDQAYLFTQDEVNQLSSIVSSLQSAHDIDVLVVTTDDAQGMSPREYADRFILAQVGTDQDAVLQLIDMDNREVYISTSGRAIDILTDARIESVLDAMFDNGMQDSRFGAAAIAGLSSISSYLTAGVPADGYREEESGPNSLNPAEAAAGVGGGGALGIGHFLSERRKYRLKTRPKQFSFRSNSLVNLSLGGDRLLDTQMSSRVIPVVQPARSSSGGGGGRSTTHRTGGGTFGGGGRKF